MKNDKLDLEPILIKNALDYINAIDIMHKRYDALVQAICKENASYEELRMLTARLGVIVDELHIKTFTSY